MDNINELYNNIIKCLEEHNDDVVFINNNWYFLEEIMKMSSDDLYKLLSGKVGTKLYYYLFS